MADIYHHQDKLGSINDELQLSKKLDSIHEVLKERFPFIARVSVALYDEKTDLVKTFIDSSETDEEKLQRYQAPLSETSSLKEIAERRCPRVVNDLEIFSGGEKKHTRTIAKGGYKASYTLPIFARSKLFGFLFFNSYERDVFTENVLYHLDPFGHLIALTIISNLEATFTLLAAVKTAREISHLRDEETGAHLDRMSRYSRIIAQKIADKYQLTDEHIEKIFEFSPLHDIGKIGIPDSILLKPGKLSGDEFEQMKSHAVLGKIFIDNVLRQLDVEHLEYAEMMRNIAELHHEAVDGSGYPNGLKRDEIPIEARIVAVADVFDALTSKRPYKEAWSNQRAFDALLQLRNVKLDPDCVDALIDSRDYIEEIQSYFKETYLG